MSLDIVILGLSITSSWGNGHATTYRALTKALHARGHRVTFLERDVPWYRANRDLARSPYCRIELYERLSDVRRRFGDLIGRADLVILGSYVPDGASLAGWITGHARGVTAFYDIDTPVTLAGLENGGIDYISAKLIPRFDLYLSFTGGPVLELIEEIYGSARARPLYCAIDPEVHVPVEAEPVWSLGYLGTYSADRQPALERLLIGPAQQRPDRRFVVAGPLFPDHLRWPANVERIEHLAPNGHPAFYCAQAYTLNLTRAEMTATGYSPSVRLFEAAACGVPLITDRWAGLELFFKPGQEILIADIPEQVLQLLDLPPERRRRIAAAGRKRVLQEHTADHRARTLEQYYREVVSDRARPRVAVNGGRRSLPSAPPAAHSRGPMFASERGWSARSDAK
jgi:spore maturation protein CgeB